MKSHTRSALGRALIFAYLSGASFAKGEDIAVRVISAKTGRPIVEAHVEVVVDTPHRRPDVSPETFRDWEYTDSNGAAIFHVPSPSLPRDGWIGVAGIAPDWCSPAAGYRVDEVVRAGASKPGFASCPHRPLKKYLVQPHPGEIVIYIGEYSRWERILYFPWPS